MPKIIPYRPDINQEYDNPFKDKYPFKKIGRVLSNKDSKEIVQWLHELDSSLDKDGNPNIFDEALHDYMVHFPKFYRRRKWKGEVLEESWIEAVPPEHVDDIPQEIKDRGFIVDPVFVNPDGSIKDYVLYGAFKGVEIRGQLRSVPGRKPTVNKTIEEFRGLVRQGRDTVFNIETFGIVSMIQFLYKIAFQDLNSQKVIGEGWVSKQESVVTGGTLKLGNRSGYCSPHPSVVTRGLIEHFDFADGKGTEATLKSRVSDNVLTLSGFNFDTNSGWTGKGLKFDGVNDNCNTNIVLPLDEKKGFTLCVEATCLFPQNNFANKLTLKPDNTQNYSFVFSEYRSLVQNMCYTKAILAKEEDNNQVLVVEGGKVSYYVSGKLVSVTDYTLGTQTQIVKLWIGGYLDRYFTKGDYHSIKIYNVALTPEEIAQNYEYEQSIDRTTVSTYPMLQEQKSYGIGLANQLSEEQKASFRLNVDGTKFVAGLRYCEGLEVEEFTYSEIQIEMEKEEWASVEENNANPTYLKDNSIDTVEGTKNDMVTVENNKSPEGVNGDQISVFGIEDFYGNVNSFIDGFLITDEGYHITNDPNKIGNYSEYELLSSNVLTDKNGYIQKMSKECGTYNLPSSTKNEVVTRGLIEHFDFADGKGTETTLKSRVSDNMLTLSGFNFDANSGWTGKGLRFDGVDDYADHGNYVDFRSKLNQNEITTVFNFSENPKFIGNQTGWNTRTLAYFDNNQDIVFIDGGGNKTVKNLSPVGLTSLSFTYKNAIVKVYANGKLVQEFPNSTDTLNINAVTCALKGQYWNNSYRFSSEAYSIKIYNVALTEEEIQQNYEYEQSIDRTTASTYPLLQEQKSYGIGLSNQLSEEQKSTFRLSVDGTKFVAGLRYCEGLEVEEFTYSEILKVMETEEWRGREEVIEEEIKEGFDDVENVTKEPIQRNAKSNFELKEEKSILDKSYCDYVYTHKSTKENIATIGSWYSSWSKGGMFSVDLSKEADHISENLGSRLVVI